MMKKTRSTRFKLFAIMLVGIVLCLQLSPAFAANEVSISKRLTLAERVDAAAAAVQTLRNTSATGENFSAAIDTLESNLKAIYPDEFHDNLDALDNTYKPVGGLTERQYAMSDIEWKLDVLRNVTTDEDKNNYLESLRNDICEVEYSIAETEQAEIMSLLHELETADGSEVQDALTALDSILQSRYAKPFSTALTDGSQVLANVQTQPAGIDCVQNYRSAAAVGDMQKATALSLLEEEIADLFASDPFLAMPMIANDVVSPTVINVPLIMQEDNTKCSAATIQQTLTFINGSCPYSQTQIKNATGAGPGLDTVLNYINNRISGVKYSRQNFTGATSFYRWTLRAKEYSRPIVFTFKNNDPSLWPFTTSGHFNNCAGYFSLSFNLCTSAYFFVDPFYYSEYGFTGLDEYSEGQIITNYDCLSDVNGQLHGDNNKTIGAY